MPFKPVDWESLFEEGTSTNAIRTTEVKIDARHAAYKTIYNAYSDRLAGLIRKIVENNGPISKALPLRLILEGGKVSDEFIRLLQAVGDKRVFLYYRADRPLEVAMADQAKAALKDKGLEWLAANVIPVQEGEVLPQLMAIMDEKNVRVLFTDSASGDFASSIEMARVKDGLARFVAVPDKAATTLLTAQEYFAVLYVAAARLTALGQPSDYNNPAILSIFRSGWAKFIALPIKLLEELRKAAALLRQTEVAA